MLEFKDIKITANKKLHSREHLLADDLCRLMMEPKRFGAYLGIAQMYPESELRALAKRVLEKKDLPGEARGKYFFAALKDLPRLKPVELESNAGHRTKRK